MPLAMLFQKQKRSISSLNYQKTKRKIYVWIVKSGIEENRDLLRPNAILATRLRIFLALVILDSREKRASREKREYMF